MKLKAVLRSSIHIHDVVFRVFPSSTEQEDPEYWGIALSFLAVIVYILPEWKKSYMKSLARFWTNEHYLQATLVAPRSKEWVCGLSHSGNVGSNPAGAWMSVSCECCVLSGRGLCDGPIPRPEEPYGMCARARHWVWSGSIITLYSFKD